MHAEYLSQLISKPWAIDRVRGRTILRSLAARLLKAERPAEDLWGDPIPKMQIVGDVALIPLQGVLDLEVPQWLKELYGIYLTDANDIEEEINQALSDSNVRLIVYDVNSPGGGGLAAEKLFDLTEAANRKKPFCAWVRDGGLACSGAMWAMAPCMAINAGDYADAIGNVGAYMSLLDDTEFWAQLGIKFEVLRSGEYKGIGEDPLSEAQRAYLQSIVDECGDLFRKNVRKYRTGIAEADLQGQWYKGSDAARRGFITGTAKDMGAAIAKFRRLI